MGFCKLINKKSNSYDSFQINAPVTSDYIKKQIVNIINNKQQQPLPPQQHQQQPQLTSSPIQQQQQQHMITQPIQQQQQQQQNMMINNQNDYSIRSKINIICFFLNFQFFMF